MLARNQEDFNDEEWNKSFRNEILREQRIFGDKKLGQKWAQRGDDAGLKNAAKQEAERTKMTLLLNDNSARVRRILFDWLWGANSLLNLPNECYFGAVYYVDAYLTCKALNMANFTAKLQLLGTAALWVASKLYSSIKLSIYQFTSIAANSFSPKQLCAMEMELVVTCISGLRPPNVYECMELCLSIMSKTVTRYTRDSNCDVINCDTILRKISEASTLFCIFDSLSVLLPPRPPYIVAVAAVLLAANNLRNKVPDEVIKEFWKYLTSKFEEFLQKDELSSELLVLCTVSENSLTRTDKIGEDKMGEDKMGADKIVDDGSILYCLYWFQSLIEEQHWGRNEKIEIRPPNFVFEK